MAVIHGSVGAFDNAVEDWSSYSERLEEYFKANDVEAGVKQRAILLSNCGPQTYQLVKNLLAPNKPMDHTFSEIVTALRNHWQPKPSQIVQRFNFHSRMQKAGESIAEYVAELRRLSGNCGFGSAEQLDDMLRDRLVCGVRDARIQQRLLAEAELKFKKAFDLAQAMETAEQNVKELQGKTEKTVHRVKEIEKFSKTESKTQTISEGTCYQCGGKHKQTDCRFKEATCRACGKTGHIARVCRSKPAAGPRPTRTHSGRQGSKKQVRTYHIED